MSVDDEIHVPHQVGCARCEGDGHDDLTFRRLTHPVVVQGPPVCGEVELTHWCPCPTNGEPILMAVLERQETQVG